MERLGGKVRCWPHTNFICIVHVFGIDGKRYYDKPTLNDSAIIAKNTSKRTTEILYYVYTSVHGSVGLVETR